MKGRIVISYSIVIFEGVGYYHVLVDSTVITLPEQIGLKGCHVDSDITSLMFISTI